MFRTIFTRVDNAQRTEYPPPRWSNSRVKKDYETPTPVWICIEVQEFAPPVCAYGSLFSYRVPDFVLSTCI